MKLTKLDLWKENKFHSKMSKKKKTKSKIKKKLIKSKTKMKSELQSLITLKKMNKSKFWRKLMFTEYREQL